MYTVILFLSISLLLLFTANRGENIIKNKFQLDRSYTNVLRGLAMVMIMFGHVGGEYEESVWFSPLPGIGVALFLMLSGYGNNESYLKRGKWESKKMFRIALPYWLIAIPIFCIYGVNDWMDCFLKLSFIRVKSVYWFVGFIMQWYVVYWFAINYYYKFRWLVFGGFSIFTLIFLPPLQIEQAISFPIGIWLSEKKACMSEKSSKCIFSLACFLCTVSTLALGCKQIELVRYHMEYVPYIDLLIKLPYAFTLILILHPLRILTNHRLLVFVGTITYELYLVHMQCLKMIDTNSPTTTIISTLLFIVVSFVGACILKRINNKILHLVGI